MPKINDNAIAPSAGYIFQFEKALLMFPELDINDFLSIEQVDDIAKLRENGTIILTVQVKHSISNSGSIFQDTSLALWRTLEIWISKLESGIFNNQTIFCFSSNKEIPKKLLLSSFKEKSFDEILVLINDLLDKQKAKLNTLKRTGNHIKRIISLIEFVLKHQSAFKIIVQNIKFSIDSDSKANFLNKIHFNSRNKTQHQKDNCYEAFYGWIVQNCMNKWKNGNEAVFSKTDFDTKYSQIVNNPTIVDAIFKAKKDFSDVDNLIFEKYKDTLFVKQIKDLTWRKSAKESAINDAILDFIYSEIELKNIIDIGDYTSQDFDDFTELCKRKWEEWYDSLVIRDLDDYTEAEKNRLAVDLFLKIMKQVEIKFGGNYQFTDNTKYIQNGTFLKLSDEPRIGWHPEWEIKYFDYKENGYGEQE